MRVATACLLTVVLHGVFLALASSNPCSQYESVTMDKGYRSSDFNSFDSPISLCDYGSIRSGVWYRFNMDAGTRLKEGYVPPWHCGTQAPIWIDGTHPTDYNLAMRSVCATTELNSCFWTDNVTIQMCNDSSEIFYVYQLAQPSGCPIAYCVDAATRKDCQPPLIWREDEFRCGENVTSPPTTPPLPTTPYTTPTVPPGYTGWAPWGTWTACSKPCDYGCRTRKRTCVEPPCQGEAIDYEVCSEYNCKEVEEEKDKGLIMKLGSEGDTMLQVVKTEEKVTKLIRDSLNALCLSNASICCGRPVQQVVSSDTVFVTYNGIYTPSGFPQSLAYSSVAQKIIAVVAEDVNNKICLNATRLLRRQSTAAEPNYISYEGLHNAVVNCEELIHQETGLTIDEYIRPEDWQTPESCPLTTCVYPIVFGILGAMIVVIVIVAIYCFLHLKSRVNVQPPRPPPPPPTPPPPPPYPESARGQPDELYLTPKADMPPAYEIQPYAMSETLAEKSADDNYTSVSGVNRH